MFLEFFIWGAWLPLAYDYLTNLSFSSFEKSLIMNAFAAASITGLFFSNQFADRNFAAERFLAFSHLVGGASILAIAWVRDFPVWEGGLNLFGERWSPHFWPFFGLMLLHSLFYVPTISVSNSIVFSHLPPTEFAKVRLWGTIGWIAASVPFVFILLDWTKVRDFSFAEITPWFQDVFNPDYGKKGEAYLHGVSLTYMAAGIASLALAVFSLALPHTPPKPIKSGEKHFAWLESIRLLAKPFILVLFIVTFIDAAVHQGYFLLTAPFLKNEVGIAPSWVMPVMTIGQIAEIGTMAILGGVLKALGWRWTMILGILGHTARFGVFAFFPEPAPAVLINVLHGICYAFFFATVYIFVDEYFPKDARASAQGLFNFLIIGIGPLVGNFLWPFVEGHFTTVAGLQSLFASLGDKELVFQPKTIVDYYNLFLVPSITALVAAAMLLVFFHPPAKGTDDNLDSYPDEYQKGTGAIERSDAIKEFK
jgi:MFS family permease